MSKIPGARFERREPGDPQFDQLLDQVERHGWSDDSPILIGVNFQGEPYIIEGNTRAAVAKYIGKDSILAEVRWWDGGELEQGPLTPKDVKSMIIESVEGVGTFVGLRPSKKTIENIKKYIQENNIPNPQPEEELHTTLLLDRDKQFPWTCKKYSPALTNDGPIELHLFGENKDTLVMTFDNEILQKRHLKGREKYKIEWRFDEYRPHITIANDLDSDFDLSSLPPIDFDIELVFEYSQPYISDKDLISEMVPMNVKNPLLERIDYEACDKYTGLEKDICNYTRNEFPIVWTDKEMKKARQLYGSVDVGVVYHGGKITNKNTLRKIKSLSPGAKIRLTKLMSATPDRHNAMSYAQYVKSYDEMTMLYMLKKTIEHGSAGEFGTFLLTLKPAPRNVIVKTYKDDNEKSQNPKFKGTSAGVEDEVLLYGNVEVVDVQIFEPINKDNYKEVIPKLIVDSGEELDIIQRWVSHRKDIDVQELTNLVIDKLLEQGKSKVEILSFKGNLVMAMPRIALHPVISSFIQKNIQIGEEGIFVEENNERVFLSISTIELFDMDAVAIRNTVQILSKRLENNYSIEEGPFEFSLSFNESIKKAAITLYQLLEVSDTAKEQFAKTKIGRDIKNLIDEKVKKFLTLNQDTFEDFWEEFGLRFFRHVDLTYLIDNIALFNRQIQSKYKSILLRHLTDGMAPKGQPSRRYVELYQEFTPRIMKKIVSRLDT